MEFQSGEKVQTLNGLGGIGKTQTALEYAYRHRENYKVIFWGKAHSIESLVTDFATMAGLLNLPQKDAQDQSEAVGAVKRWLENNDGWLLILDNADELSMAREFIPLSETGHVLLTTRAQNAGTLAARNPIDKMEPGDGALFLLRRLKMLKEGESLESAAVERRTQAEALSKAVDGLPLALDQAAAYIEARPSTLREYQAHYRSERTRLLAVRGELATDHPESVAVTFSLAFKRVAGSSPAAADLLHLCAFLDADAIPEEIFSEGGKELGENLSAIAASPVSLTEVIGEAGRYSLLRRDPEARTVSLHRLVQAVLIGDMEEEDERVWAERAVCAVNSVFPEVEYQSWKSCSRIILHAQKLARIIDEFDFEFSESARLMNEAGVYLHYRAQYGEAEPLFCQALKIREKAFGPGHPATAESLNNLAALYSSQGKYGEAEPLSKRAMEIDEETLGPEHPATATSLHNLAELYRAQGKYEKAGPLFQQALKTREKALGPDHPTTAQSLNHLAELYRSQGKYGEAEPLYKRALEIDEKALGPEHPATAVSLHNMAALYSSQGKYGEAESLYKRALEIRKNALGPEHPACAVTLNNLAELYRSQSKYDQAESLYKRTMEIRERALGPEHPDSALSLNNLAFLYFSQGKNEESEPLYKRALEIREEALGLEHPDTAVSLHNLAALYDSQGKYGEAEPLYKQALEIWEKALGPEHPYPAASLDSLAGLYRRQGKYKEAESHCKRALGIYEKAFGKEHPDTAISLNNLAGLYREQGKCIEAELLYQRALEIYEKAFGLEHPDTATFLDGYAKLLRLVKREDEAVKLETQAKEIRESTKPKEKK